MSVRGIPGQPLSFEPTLLQGCGPCNLVDDYVHYETGADIVVQLLQDQCGQTQLLPSPDFDVKADWDENGWSMRIGDACIVANGIQVPAPLQEVGYVLTPGVVYFLQIDVTSITGSLTIAAGGVTLGAISGAGSFFFTFEAATAQSVTIFPDDENTSACIALANLFVQREDFVATLYDETGAVVVVYDWTDGVFVADGPILLLTIPTVGLSEGCYTLGVEDECEGTTILSNPIRITSDPCMLLRVCGGGAQFGLAAGAEFTIAVPGKITRPSYDYESETVTGGSGRILRHYARRSTRVELRVLTVGETMHRFLSMLPLWQHVYIGQQEIVVAADGYEPDYSDVYDVGGPVLLKADLQQSAVTMVLCDEPAEGCTPPPNFLVQLTGPNYDYILLQDGGRIRLHN